MPPPPNVPPSLTPSPLPCSNDKSHNTPILLDLVGPALCVFCPLQTPQDKPPRGCQSLGPPESRFWGVFRCPWVPQGELVRLLGDCRFPPTPTSFLCILPQPPPFPNWEPTNNLSAQSEPFAFVRHSFAPHDFLVSHFLFSDCPPYNILRVNIQVFIVWCTLRLSLCYIPKVCCSEGYDSHQRIFPPTSPRPFFIGHKLLLAL